MARVFDDGTEAFQKPQSMAQPFLLEPIPGVSEHSDLGCADDEFVVENWSPVVAHTLGCPTTRPLARVASKGKEIYECVDCAWVYER